MTTRPEYATAILTRLSAGDDSAAAQLMPMVYDELRALAGHYFKAQSPGHTLQPTALVHEAFVRLISQKEGQWADRAHFMALAAQAMRHILIDHARTRQAAKRGGDDERRRLTLDDALRVIESRDVDVLALDEALSRLGERSERQARIVELRVFGGLTIDEVGDVLKIGKTTVQSDWAIAKIWLKRELAD